MAGIERAQRDGVVIGLGEIGIYQRLDIDQFLLNKPDTFNLFLLALTDLQKDEESLWGYNEIAGIHGLPMRAWDNVKPPQWDRFGGYCAHGTITFLTWHRPYLAMIEQALYLKMVEKANAFREPYKTKYLQAAKEFRLPFWDYFRPRAKGANFPGIMLPGGRTETEHDYRMPDIFNVDDVMVRVPPDDNLEKHKNPLYTFVFSQDHGLSPVDWRKIDASCSRKQTVRHSLGVGVEKHGVKYLNETLNMQRESNSMLTLQLIHDESYGSLGAISTNAAKEAGIIKNGLSGSLEGSIHNNYHCYIGGLRGGHMGQPSVSAFDPVFWFHHCQIDRLFAIWQALHPNAWFPVPNPFPQDEKSPLLPFRISKGTSYYDSDLARRTTTFGYTYPDIEDVKDIQTLWQRFKANYFWDFRNPTAPDKGDPPPQMEPLDLSKAQVFQYASVGSAPLGRITKKMAILAESVDLSDQLTLNAVLGGTSPNPIERKVELERSDAVAKTTNPTFKHIWYIDSVVQRHAFNGPFTIYFFIGPRLKIPTNSEKYMIDPHLAGLHHIFVAPREACDNCGQQDAAGQLASDTTIITPLLLDYQLTGDLESMQPEHVKPFLIQNLCWRVVLYAEEQTADPRHVPGLEISISARVSHDGGSSLDTYDFYPEIIEAIIRNAGDAT